MDNAPALEVSALDVYRGRLRVVHEVSFVVPRGHYVGLLGLNGAGKTTLLSALAGTLPSASGHVRLLGSDLARSPSWDRCRAGLVMVPAGRQLFGGLTVWDNLLVGAHLTPKKSRLQDLDRVCELFPILGERRHQLAATLSGGQQQMVALGRALMARPKVLLLDEPSEGLAPLVVSQVFEALKRLRQLTDVSIVLAEQNASAITLCDSLLVMRSGRLAEHDHPGQADVDSLAKAVFAHQHPARPHQLW